MLLVRASVGDTLRECSPEFNLKEPKDEEGHACYCDFDSGSREFRDFRLLEQP